MATFIGKSKQSIFLFIWHLNTSVYAQPIQNQEELGNHITLSSGTMRNTPAILWEKSELTHAHM